MRKAGICPKCNSSEVYNNSKETPRGERNSIPLSSWVSLMVHVYVCLECGYIEEYMNPNDLLNEKKTEKIRSTWRKV